MTVQTGILRRKFGRIIVNIAAFVVGSIGLYVITAKVFSIQTIEVVGSGMQVRIDEARVSRNLIFFPSEKLKSQLLADNPLLSDVQFIKLFPHTLRIVPIVRSPYIILQIPDRRALVDASGVVLTDGDNGLSLPIVTVSLPAIRVGEKISDPAVQQSLGFLKNTADILPIQSITEIDGGYLQAISGKTNIFFPQDRPIGDVLATLQMLITGFRIKGTLPTVVDLRFDKPIIK